MSTTGIRNTLYSMRNLLPSIIGDQHQFTLENRIFNAIAMLALVIMAINIPYNYLTGLPVTSLIFAILVVAFSGIYYLSRFKRKVGLSITISVILINIMFAINYFFSSGIQGASLLSFTLAFFLTMLISPTKQYPWWICLNLFTVLGIIIFEYIHPNTVLNVYKTRKDIFADMTPTYIINVVGIFIGTIYLKGAYNKEKKKGEEKAQRLEIMDSEKNKLFSLLSHDLRNPLAAIQSYLQLLRDIELEQKDKAQIETELLYVVNSTQEMLYNILIWSKTQMDGLCVNLVPVDVAAAIQPILKINKLAIVKKKIQLDESIDTSIKAMADINMLQLIVRNLVGNAAKFTPAGGSINIKTMRSGNNCLIEIKDSGAGIDPSGIADIFSLKVRSTFGTDNEKGVGLGLFLCKEYTAAQQGQIWFESTKGSGSTFYVSLPLAN
jgi:two-component system sensor histidine kinase/response regulator